MKHKLVPQIVRDGNLSPAARPKYLNVHPDHLSEAEFLKRENVLKTWKTGRHHREAAFTICRRLALVREDQLTESDAVDNCRGCGTEVVYDSTFSHGRPHICSVCANRWAYAGVREVKDVVGAPIEGNDQEMFARLAANVSQNKTGAIARPEKRSLNAVSKMPSNSRSLGHFGRAANARPLPKPKPTP